MRIAGYFSKRGNSELRMPKPGDAKSEPWIRFDGPVLNGEKSMEEQCSEAAVRATSHPCESYHDRGL
jgi:hypothetical protein